MAWRVVGYRLAHHLRRRFRRFGAAACLVARDETQRTGSAPVRHQVSGADRYAAGPRRWADLLTHVVADARLSDSQVREFVTAGGRVSGPGGCHRRVDRHAVRRPRIRDGLSVDTLAPDTTQLLYDLIWFLFLIPWPPFMLWQFLTGFAILSDANRQTMFPRWTGYFSLWAGALEVFSALSVFFYSGPFSYNGLVTFWVPGVSFFGWVLVMAIVQVRRLPLARAALAGESSTNETPNDDAELEPIRIPSAAGI